MAIRVKDIIDTQLLENAVVLSGHNGLDRIVHRIASIERPFTDHREYSWHVAKPGDLYVSKLFVFEGAIDKLHEELEFQHRTKACGLITHKEMIPFFDELAIEMSNQYGLPIIAIDDAIGFTELIFSVTDLIIKDKTMQAHVRHFESLLQSDLTRDDIKKSIINLEWELKSRIQCVFLNTCKAISLSRYKLDTDDILLPIYGGAAYIITDDQEKNILKKKRHFIENVKAAEEQYCFGISRLHSGIENTKTAVLEALYAYVFCRNMRQSIMEYEALGTFSLLSGLNHHDCLQEYKEKFYTKISEFDSEGKLDLEQIIELFAIFGGDFRLVSDELYLHESTVRYRMNKLKAHMQYKNHNDLYADIKMAVYAKWIAEDQILQIVKESN